MTEAAPNYTMTRTAPADFLLAPKSLEEAMKYAEVIAKSGIIPKHYIGKAADVLVAIQLGMELGLPPLQSLQSIAVINGSPSIFGDGLIAIVRGSKLCKFIVETFDEPSMTATCSALRRGDDAPQSRTFSQADATTAGLWSKQGPWQQYPKRMLQMRARSWCLRDLFPDVLRGVAVREEVEDFRHMGDAERVATDTPQGTQTQRVKERLREQRKPGMDALQPSMSTSAPADAAAKKDPPKLPDVDELAERISQAEAMSELEALGNAVDEFPRGSEDRQTLVAILKARKQALEAGKP